MIASPPTGLMKSRIQRTVFWLNPMILAGLVCKMVLDISGYQDAETLLQGAKLLSLRLNPYENPFFLNSYVLAPAAQILSSPFSQVNGARIYTLLNLLLIALVIWDLCRNLNSREVLIVVFIVLASSPTRAMVASVQHTGLILGFSYFAYKIACIYQLPINFPKFLKYALVSVFLLIPIELKPQLMLPLIAVFIFHQKLRSYIIFCLALASILHLGLSFYLRMPLDKYWLTRLLSRSSETTSGDSRENSPWTLLGNVVGHPKIWLGLSSLIFITLIFGLCYKVRRMVLTENYFLVSLSIPLVLAYIHPYDLIIPIIVVAYLFVKVPKALGSTFLLALYLLPTIGLDLLSLSFTFGLIILIWYTSGVRLSCLLKDCVELVLSMIVYFLFNQFIQDLGLRVNIHMSILIVGSSILIGLHLVIPTFRKKTSLSVEFFK